YQFQLRTFWIGLLYVVVGAVLVTFVPVIGVAILIWWVNWSLVRNIKGLLALNDHKAIQGPASWMFGLPLRSTKIEWSGGRSQNEEHHSIIRCDACHRPSACATSAV